MTRHYTHVGELAASQAVAALPVIDGNTYESRSNAESAMEPMDRIHEVRRIVQESTQKTWAKDRKRILSLLSAG
jgi:hypothetical protein